MVRASLRVDLQPSYPVRFVPEADVQQFRCLSTATPDTQYRREKH